VTFFAGESELRVTPSPLDFGWVSPGTTATRSLTLQNTSLMPLSVQTTASWPFDTSSDVRVEGDDSAALEVRFAPAILGDAPGTLDLAWKDTHLFVPLRGVGVDCPPVDACQLLQLQGDRCVAVPAADGTACTAACVTDATCQGGACVGTARSCDDGNPCTVDSCDPSSGCNHVAVICGATRCNRPTGRCDPSTGCELTPLDDGTPCGDSACAWADVCVGGNCQRAATPNADVECHYTDVVATNDLTCALTQSGHVRCWGDLEQTFLTTSVQYPAPPTTMDGFSNIVAMAADDSFCAVDASGVIHCGRQWMEPSGGSVADPVSLSITNLSNWFYNGIVVSANGEATTWAPGEALVPFDGGIVHGVVLDDGAWVLDETDHLVRYLDDHVQDSGAMTAGSKVATFGSGSDWVLAVIAPDGTVELNLNSGLWCSEGCPELWGSPLDALGGYRWDAGAVTVGGSQAQVGNGNDNSFYACAAQSGGSIVCRMGTGGFERRYRVPGEVMKLTQRGNSHVCALNDLGDIWCFGDNSSGQLGQPPVRAAPQWLGAPVSSMTVGFTISNGELYEWRGDFPSHVGWGQQLFGFDGGAEWTGSRDLGPSFGAAFTGGTPLLLQGDQLFQLNDGGLQHLATGIVRCDGLGARACDGFSPSQWACLDTNGRIAFYGSGCFGGGQPTNGCALVEDGGVRCAAGPVTLPGAATALSTMGWPEAGCALLRSGEVRCWDDPSDVPQLIIGLAPGVRQLSGSLHSGCALVGPNAVQCWGNNSADQVGPPGPSTPAMSTRVFDEPVVQLSSSSWGNFLFGLCVQLESGRAGCWGDNSDGTLGPLLLRSQLPIQVVR
jgi:hypothetical protein